MSFRENRISQKLGRQREGHLRFPSLALDGLRENRVICSSRKIQCLADFPNYVGMYILDMAKYILYDCYYNKFKKHYSKLCELIYTDTDSYILNIKCDDII